MPSKAALGNGGMKKMSYKMQLKQTEESSTPPITRHQGYTMKMNAKGPPTLSIFSIIQNDRQNNAEIIQHIGKRILSNFV